MNLRRWLQNTSRKLSESSSPSDSSKELEERKKEIEGCKKELEAWKEDWSARWLVWLICLAVFFLPFVFYHPLLQAILLDRPVIVEVGIFTVPIAFGGFLLSAGVSTRIPNREETIRVAKKFIYVVVLTVFSLPALHFVEFIGGVNVNSLEPDSLDAWFRGFYFWLAAISFYLAIILFIIALVDLVYVLVGMGNTEQECKKTDSALCRKDSCSSG